MTPRTPIIGLLAGALLIAVVALGAAGFALARPTTAQAQAVGVPGLRQVTVVGSGEAKVAPDMATVQIGVETSAPTTQEALAQNNTQAQAIIDQVKQLGVAEADIQTSGFNINPTYDTNGREITGYSVSNMVSVTIRDLAKAGALLDQVVQAGANRVYGVSFGVSNAQEVLGQARIAAMADAKDRADQLAAPAGAAVGQVLVISENIGAAPVVPMMAEARADMAAGSVPVQAGQQSFTVQVQVTYELR